MEFIKDKLEGLLKEIQIIKADEERLLKTLGFIALLFLLILVSMSLGRILLLKEIENTGLLFCRKI